MPTVIIQFIKISLPIPERHFLFSLVIRPSQQDEEILLHRALHLPIDIMFPFDRAGMTEEQEEAFINPDAHILVHTHIFYNSRE
jgi:hypothetical protein